MGKTRKLRKNLILESNDPVLVQIVSNVVRSAATTVPLADGGEGRRRESIEC